MRIEGEWRRFPDGVTRPVVLAEIAGEEGKLIGVRFLVDSGADRTVFNAALTLKLNLPIERAEDRLRGVTGDCDFVTMQSALEFKREGGGTVRVRGEFLGLTDPHATDLCVLGRDVLDNFDVIQSRRHDEVLLLAPPHTYQVMVA